MKESYLAVAGRIRRELEQIDLLMKRLPDTAAFVFKDLRAFADTLDRIASAEEEERDASGPRSLIQPFLMEIPVPPRTGERCIMREDCRPPDFRN